MNTANNSRRSFIETVGKVGVSSAVVLGAPSMSSALGNGLRSDEKNPGKSALRNAVLTKADRKEYGIPAKLDLAHLGLTPAKKKYSFIVMADPQGGNPDVNNVHGRIGPTNENIKKLVESINREPVQPEFVVVAGDVVDDEGETEHFEAMHAMLSKINAPILYEMGNHETHYTPSGRKP